MAPRVSPFKGNYYLSLNHSICINEEFRCVACLLKFSMANPQGVQSNLDHHFGGNTGDGLRAPSSNPPHGSTSLAEGFVSRPSPTSTSWALLILQPPLFWTLFPRSPITPSYFVQRPLGVTSELAVSFDSVNVIFLHCFGTISPILLDSFLLCPFLKCFLGNHS